MTMDTVNGKSNAPSSENENASDVSAETPLRTQLQQRIETQRMQLLQAHSVLVCRRMWRRISSTVRWSSWIVCTLGG
jgi:hypothetical protein